MLVNNNVETFETFLLRCFDFHLVFGHFLLTTVTIAKGIE